MRIVFSHKQLQQLFKNFIDQDDNELGKQQRDELLNLWKKQDKKQFLNGLFRLSEDTSWKTIKLDCVYWYEVLNAIDAFLQDLHDEGLQINIEAEMEKNVDHLKNIEIVLRFLKVFLQHSTNAIYFNSLDHLVEIFLRYENSTLIRQEVISIFINVSSKRPAKTHPHYQAGTSVYNRELTRIWQKMKSLINNLEFVCEMLINSDQSIAYSENIRSHLADMEHDKLTEETKQQIGELSVIQRIASNQSDLEDLLVLILKAVNLYIYVGDVELFEANKGSHKQKQRLEQLLPPKRVINQFIHMLKCPHLNKKVHNGLVNIMFYLVVLDLNQTFEFIAPNENVYYIELCTHHEFFNQILHCLAKYHAYDKLKLYSHEHHLYDSQDLEKLIELERTLVGAQSDDNLFDVEKNDESIFQKANALKSQKFLHNFLIFLCHLMNIKNKNMQNLLFPQFLKPLLAIVSVYPVYGVYPININCQVKAAKLLKDVVKHASLEDPCAVEKLIIRLKAELKIIHQDVDQWKKAEDDDTESQMLLAQKQEFIKTCLRFLCYSVIREDPNAISFNQNFIANSRKILESNIIQNELMEYIFNKNMSGEEAQIKKVIEPIILQGIQLISYVFNDLPQKISQFLENGVIPQIIKSLSVRMPIQQDMIILVTKFLQMICLNPEGQKLVASSDIVDSFIRVACNSKAYKLIINMSKAFNYRDQFQQFAMLNYDISVRMYQQLMKNFQVLNERAWGTTEHFLNMERQCQTDTTLSEDQKLELRTRYDKEQVALEYCYENAAHFLWYYAIDETQYGADNIIYKSIKDNQKFSDILLDVISTPIVASACPNMFRPFIEVSLQIIRIHDVKYETDFLTTVASFLGRQVENLFLATGVTDFDVLDDLQDKVKENENIILAEQCKDEEKLKMVTYLRGEDQVSVTFGKIALYCDIIRATNQETKQVLIKQDMFPDILTKIFKLQALINRYHAQIYQKELIKEKTRFEELMKTYSDQLAALSFKDFKIISDPMNEFEEAQNLYYRYHEQVIISMTDSQAKINQKTVIELQLEENMSHTSNMCQLAIRKLIMSILKANANSKKKYHFSQAIDEKVLSFFTLIGKLLAEEFKEFSDMKTDESRCEESYIMRICCQHSAVLGEFNKVLFSNFGFGNMLVEFISNQGLEYVEQLVKWIIKTVDLYETKNANKRIDLCKHIQLLWSHIIDFYFSLTEGAYLDHQYQHFAIAFKTNPSEAVPENQINEEHENIVRKMKIYLYNVMSRTMRFLFVDLNQEKAIQRQNLNVFSYFDKYSELFFSSFMEVYQFLCQGLMQCKFFANDPLLLLTEQSQLKQKVQQGRNFQKLLEMGFTSDAVIHALEESKNNFDQALELLFSKQTTEKIESDDKQEKQDQKSQNQIEKTDNQDLAIRHEFKMILAIIEESFDQFIYLNPTNYRLVDKYKIIENTFFKLGSKVDDKDIYQLLESIRSKILNHIQVVGKASDTGKLGILCYSLECLLKYKRSVLLNSEQIFSSLEVLSNLFMILIKELKSIVSDDDFDKYKDGIQQYIRIIDSFLSLFLYIAEESKISSDLTKIDSIITPESSLMETIDELTNQLKLLSHLNEQNVFYQSKEKTGKILTQSTLAIIELFKAMHNMNPQFESSNDFAVYVLIVHALENLNFYHTIKGFGDFDFQQLFLKNEGLKAIFGIKSVSITNTSAIIQNKEIVKEIQTYSMKLLQQLCTNEQTQVKIYENLIKSVLFIQFQERYKREEGHDIKSILITEDMKQGAMKQSATSKKKKSHTPVKRSKSEEKFMKDFDSNHANQLLTSKKTKNKEMKQLYKKIDYCETHLSDFIQFFNSVMQIQDLKSFLQACSNVCIIKRKIEVDEGKSDLSKRKKEKAQNEEVKDSSKIKIQTQAKNKDKSKEEEVKQPKVEKEQEIASDKNNQQQQESVFISLSTQALKEMFLSLTQQYQLGMNDADYQKQPGNATKGHQQKFQNEIVYTLLDQVIDQLRDHQMLVLQLSKSKSSPTIQGLFLKLNEKYQLVVSPGDKVKQNRYLFDYVNIMGHLSYILTHTPILIQALMKHKEGKTYKFLIRNIYFLLTLTTEKVEKVEGNMETDQQELRCYFDDRKIDRKQTDLISEFFKKILLDNPHLNIHEKRIKHEARQIFIKELLKNLCETGGSQKYQQWPQLRLVFNIGALWLISEILAEENQKEQKHDKKLENLVMSMKKYRNMLRNILIKQMIVECQQMLKGEQQQQFFNIIRNIERIQTEILEQIVFFENAKDQIQSCLSALINVLRPFEDSKILKIDKDGDKQGDINESNLGFLNHQDQHSEISELDEEDEEDVEDDSEESESSITDQSDDELLDSNPSQRNYQFSDADGDDYGDEEDMPDTFSDISDYNMQDNASEHLPQIGILDEGYESLEDDYGLDVDMDDDDDADDGSEVLMVPPRNMQSNDEQQEVDEEYGNEEEEEEEDDEESKQRDEGARDEGELSYFSESGGEHSQGTSYYEEDDISENEQEDDDQEPLEIHIRPFRQGNNRDQQQVMRQANRDDLMSLHNLSLDQFNMFSRNHNLHAPPQHVDNHLVIQGNNFAQQIFTIHNQRRLNRENRGNPGDVNFLDQIVGMINNLLGENAQIRSAEFKFKNKNSQDKVPEKESLIHNPTLFLSGIQSFSTSLALSEDLYKMFIKEKEEPKYSIQQATSIPALKGPTKLQSESTTKSQFSSKNPFEQIAANKEHVTGTLFGNTQTGTFQRNQIQTNQVQTSERPQEQMNQVTANNARQIFAESQIDPEFLDSLDQEGLQNLADTENMINRFNLEGHQNRINSTVALLQSVSNVQQRQELLRNLPEDVLNQLPSNLFSEALIYRQLHRNRDGNALDMLSSDQSSDHNQNERQQLQPHRVINMTNIIQSLRGSGPIPQIQSPQRNGQEIYSRSRFMSVDSQFNCLGDFSRGENEPYQKPSAQSKNTVSEFTLKQNSLFSNVVHNIKDLISEMRQNSSYFDYRGAELEKACEQIFQQTLLPQGDNIEANYSKVAGLVQMFITTVKMQFQSLPIRIKESRLLKILFRIPTFRTGLLTALLLFFNSGIHQLQDYVQSDLFNRNSRLIVGQQTFKVDMQMDQKHKIDIHDFVVHFLVTFKWIQKDLNKVSSSGVLDLLKSPAQDQQLQTILNILCQASQHKFEKSMIEVLMDQVTLFDHIATQRPDIIQKNGGINEQRNLWFVELTSLLQIVIRNICNSIKIVQSNNALDKKTQKGTQILVEDIVKPDKHIINKIGNLLIQREIKQKSAQNDVKRIFVDLTSLNESKPIVHSFFSQSLTNSLERFLQILQQPKINNDELQKEVIIATQILKIAKNIDKQESNICDEQLFFKVVAFVSDLIDTKQASHVQGQQGSSYIFKEEFRTIMTVIFILFEYNLKFIFVEEKKEEEKKAILPNRQNRNREVESQIKIEMQDASEIQNEIETEEGRKSKDKLDLMGAIDDHLKNKIKDAKVREDQRLKVFIKFCLLHKKLINTFIRANQQIMNESLRNVIMKVPQILDFDNKRLMFRSQIKKTQKKYRLKYHDMQIRRDKVFDDSFEQLRDVPIDKWRGKFAIEFVDEQGIDEGGLSREWFILLSQEIFNPDLALFVQSNAGSTYYPNPKSTVQPEYLQLFRFIGRIVGKALYDQQLLDCYFVKSFYKIILGLPLNYHDLEDYDNEIYKNLKWLLINSAEGIGMTFTESQDYFGKIKEVDLIEDGKNIEVTNENKYLYVQKIAYQKLYLAIKEQTDQFLAGFYDIVPLEFVQIFDNRELELLISGLPTIDIEDLRENTIYQNYTAETPVCKWLFEVLEEFDNSERAEFIQFVTGSSKVPVEGFKGLRGSRGIQKFQIVKFFTLDYNRLPMAHTCFKQLELPEYPSKLQLKNRLLTAIKEGKTFGIA